MTLINRSLKLKDVIYLLIILNILLPFDCFGDYIWTDNTNNNAVIDVDLNHFTGYTKGSTLTVNFVEHFSTIINYQVSDIGKEYNLYNYFSAKNLILPQEAESRNLKINDDLSISHFIIDGTDYVPIDINTFSPILIKFRPSTVSGKTTVDIPIKGSITLKLERDIIGGAVIVPVKIPLMYTYGAIVQSQFWPSSYGLNVLSRIYLKTSGFIPAPVLCKINVPSGEHIEFGNIVTDSLTPARESENRQIITLDYRCNAKKTLPAAIHLLAHNASFSDAIIASTNPAVGVALSRNGLPLSPGEKFSTHLQDGLGHDTLTATVTRNPAVATGSIDTGPFSASAVLILEQQ